MNIRLPRCADTAALVLAALALPDPAGAGPWLREDGAVFLSFGGNLALSEGARLPVHNDPFLYAEWGASDHLTLTLNLFTGDAGQERVAESFAIAPLDLPQDWGVASVSLGMALRQIEGLDEDRDGVDDLHVLLGGGVAWGMGLPNGWLAAETRIMARTDTHDIEGKLDLTWGHRFNDDWTGVLQLQAGHGHAGDEYAKIAPSVFWSATDSLTLSLGVTQGLTGDKGTGLTIGGWLEY